MRLKMNRYSMEIVPENSTDEAFLEEVIGLKGKDGIALAKRVNACGLSCWAYLEIRKKEETTPKIINMTVVNNCTPDMSKIISEIEKALRENRARF